MFRSFSTFPRSVVLRLSSRNQQVSFEYPVLVREIGEKIRYFGLRNFSSGRERRKNFFTFAFNHAKNFADRDKPRGFVIV
jgi:hypothetical protein